MGDFRITVEAIGGHGCGRGNEIDGHITRCRRMDCPDCRAIDFVETLKRSGCSVTAATLEHWPVPGAAGTTRTDGAGPIDDLIHGTRVGSFSPPGG